MHTVYFDGQNLFHRARSGFTGGEFPVVFNFFRGLRALVKELEPTRAVFVLEGSPKKRRELFSEYKANRAVEEGSEKHVALVDFFRQVSVCVDLLTTRFPVHVVRHPDFECDDVIYNLIKSASSAVDTTVVSTDSDFVQLLDEFSNVRVYDPVRKSFRQKHSVDYVLWKALRGDPSDNVPKIPGVGDKTAEKLVSDLPKMREFLVSDSERLKQFNRNVQLIKFETWTDSDCERFESSSPERDWDSVKSEFEKMGFSSIVKEPSWSRFCETLDKLWTQ